MDYTAMNFDDSKLDDYIGAPELCGYTEKLI